MLIASGRLDMRDIQSAKTKLEVNALDFCTYRIGDVARMLEVWTKRKAHAKY